MSDELGLLRQYAAQGSETAFEALGARYLNLVYSAALRRTGDAAMAQEITQVVFILLARKAGTLGPKTVLSGWLYRTALYVAAEALRTQRRRQKREQEAYMQSIPEAGATETAWQELAPLLDEGMARLAQADRDALVLRYFEGRSLEEVGSVLGVGEEAARKRVHRAVEKLRSFFARRGVVASAGILTGAISANSVHAAPAGLVAAVTAGAAAKGAAATGSTLTLLKGALKLMAWAKAKLAVAAVGAVVLAAGSTAVVIKEVQAARAAGYPDIQGAWQGNIPAPSLNSLVVLKVWKTNGTYRAALDAVDCGVADIPFDSFAYHYPLVGNGDGNDLKLNADATELSGIQRDAGTNIPIVLKRTTEPATILNLTEAEYAPRPGSDLQGYWKGAWETSAGPIPVSAKIAQASDGTFRVQWDSPYEGRTHLPAALVYERPRVKLALRGRGGSFEGELDASKTRIEGRWTWPAQTTSRLVLKRADPTPDLQREREKSYTSADSNQLQGHWKALFDGKYNGKPLKAELVLHIAKLPDGKFCASLDDRIDLLMGLETSRVLFQAPQVRMEWRFYGNVFRAKLQHGQLKGTYYHADGSSFPLIFKRTSDS